MLIYRYEHYQIKYQNSTVNFFFIAAGYEMAEFYIYLPVILFVCLTYLASISIQATIEDVQFQFTKSPTESGYQAKQWKQTYGLIHDFIEGIDEFFGLILLLFFTRMFIFFVVVAFRSIFDARTWSLGIIIYLAVSVSKFVIYMSLLTFQAHNMKKQVRSLAVG